jgi:membrane-bound lytic murein transglycosylase A
MRVLSLASHRPFPASSPARIGAALALGLLLLGLTACGTSPDTAASAPPVDAQADAQATPRPVLPTGDITTRNAVFKVSSFDALPGWQQDNLNEAWSAFRESCKALERKPNWKKLCAEVRAVKDPQAGRALIEREFALLTVQNTDRTREGDITGYYEPLLNGRSTKGGEFVVPVYGVPNDMYFLDWKTLPAAQRKGVATVRPNGRLLIAAPANELGAVKVDLRKFTLDTLDRRLRVRLEGDQGLPYYNRAEIQRKGQIDAPVLAWVDDPVAMYAMQVQGAGRIKMADGSVIRMQYADQNGQPFKPMKLAAQGNERVQTRGIGGAPGAEEPEQFELASPDEAVPDAAAAADLGADPAEPLTRGVRKAAPAPAPDVNDAVRALLPAAPAKPVAGPSAVSPVAPAAPARPAAKITKAVPAGSQSVVDALLPKGGKPPGKAVAGAPSPAAANAGAAGNISKSLLAQRASALESDPSYVFFRVATDQPQSSGPMGALGVPLTAGRSLAVDPRVMPLGYPVFLDAAGPARQQPRLQRLMFAQDTGGAIRGAVRADYFWGYGADAGRQARQTRHRGRMWVMVPFAEVAQLMSSKLVVRGVASAPECLVPDDEYCSAAQDQAAEEAAQP